MKPASLLREVWISTLARRIPAAMLAALAASMCVTTMLTVGRTASAETQVLARIDEAGSRTILVVDKTDTLITPARVASIAALSTVERVVGLTVPRDVRSGIQGAGGVAVPAWEIVGDLHSALTVQRGRTPRPGEAVVSTTAAATLALDGLAGYLLRGGQQFPIVGVFTARAPFDDLDAGAVIIPTDPTTAAHTIQVITTDIDAVPLAQGLVLSVLAPTAPTDLQIVSPASLATLQAKVAGEFGVFSRQMLYFVLAAGGLLTMVVVLADTLISRVELGRRRALGAPRRIVVLLILLRTVLVATAGALLGTIFSLVFSLNWVVPVPLPFAAATAVLSILVAALSTLAPAVVAANQDPVRVLRTP